MAGRTLQIVAAWVLAGLLAAAGCEPGPAPGGLDAATTQPHAPPMPPAAGHDDVPTAVSATQPDVELPAGPPVVRSAAARADNSLGEPIGEDRGGSGAGPPQDGPTDVPATSGAHVDADDAIIPTGLPPGVQAEFTMPGQGGPPIAADGSEPADPDEAARARLAAAQAAVFTAFYHVTKEINPRSYTDRIEGGTIHSDHFRYAAGLEIKSQTLVIGGRVKQFDIWLIVPADEAAGQARFEAQVRNFRLLGPPLERRRLDRLQSAGGGHLAVVSIAGPDERGFYTAEAGLVRRPGGGAIDH